MKKISFLIIFLILAQNAFAEPFEDDFEEDMSEETAENEDFDFFSEEEDEINTESSASFTDQSYSGKIYMQGLFIDGDIIKVSVISEDVTVPTVGIAFHLKYDQEKLHFLKYEPGEFLEDGGDPFYLVQNDQKKGELVFGETLRRNDRFPIGGKIISELYFQIIDKSLWDNTEFIKFEFNNGVLSTLDTVRQDIQNIEWENLYLDENGTNHWQEKPFSAEIENGQANSLMANLFAGDKFWKWLFFIGIFFFSFRKLLLYKLQKNKDKKRHMTSVNFK